MNLKGEKFLTKLAYSALGKEVLRVCRQINDSRCIGCQYGHPSQLRHECVTETSHSIFTFYFDEAIKCVELKNIRSQFKKYALESDVPQSYIEYFIKNFKWAWWLEEDEMKRSMVEEIRETTEISSILDL
jgi:hypothetical protein